MPSRKFFDQMLAIHLAVEKETTGTRDQFSKKLKIGKTTLWKCINEFKKRDISIKYDKISQTYYYDIPKDKEVRVVWEFGLFDKVE